MRRQDSVTAAIDEPKYIVVRDLLAKTNASRAQDATLVVQRDARANLHRFGLFHFILQKTRLRGAVIDAELLQAAFAGLIANWAVQGMIDEQKFHYPALAFLHQGRVRANGYPFRHVLCAANLRTRHPVNDRVAISAEVRLPIRPEPWKPHFDKAHPTIAGRAKHFVVAITRHENPDLLARLNHACALRKPMPDPVDLDVEHLNCRLVRHDLIWNPGNQEDYRTRSSPLVIGWYSRLTRFTISLKLAKFSTSASCRFAAFR